jgi:hypothetical protein
MSEQKEGEAPVADPVPTELFVIFDSQGPYEPCESELNAKVFCDHYNRRESDPLKPYTYRRYVLAAQKEGEAVPDGVTGASDPRCPKCNKPRLQPGMCWRCRNPGVLPEPDDGVPGTVGGQPE